jgi:hypothetical protein
MFIFFHPRPTQNNPLPISTPKLQNSATILQFFQPLPTQNSLRPLACWDLGSNPTGGMDVCLLWVLCVVTQRSLRRADHSSSGVLPIVARHCEWSRNLVNEEALAHWRLSRQKQTKHLYSPSGPSWSALQWTKQEMTHHYFVFINNDGISLWIHSQANDVDIVKQCSNVKDWK